MNRGFRIGKRFRLMVLAVATTLSSASLGEEPKQDDASSRRYWLDATVYSLVPGEELATYRTYRPANLGSNDAVVFGIGDKHSQFKVSIGAAFKAGRFMVNGMVKPSDKDTRTQAQEITYDLSDLKPRSLEIAREENGRVYWLSLVPRIIESPKPKQFTAADLLLDHWSFPSSPVIANDQDYLGRLSTSGGPIAWCDIPGLAKIEFSLLHLKDAESLGTLNSGVINLTHKDGTTLRISDVKNGRGEELAGGPYRVWVRWKKPTQSVEQYHESIKQRIASLKEQIKNGDESLPPGTLERLQELSESGRIGEITNGVRGVEDNELVRPGD